jgi:hypothetical protein
VPLTRCSGCAGFPRRTDWAAVKPPSDSSLRVCLSFRVLPSETLSASRSSRTPLMDFRSLQHMLDSAIHKPRAFPARFGPRSGFGHPLRGFRPPNPRRLCFAPAALVGFALRSFSCNAVIKAFPLDRAHMPFRPPVNAPQGAEGRPDRPRLLGFAPRRNPSQSASV